MKCFEKLSAKAKMIIGGIASIFGFILFFFIRTKIRAKEQMKYDLSKVESEIKITHLENESEEKKEKLIQLQQQENLIREKIKYLEEVKIKENRDVSIEELDAFFDQRGF